VGGKGFGSKGLFHSKGDMYVETNITIPKKLSREEEKLWKELRKLDD
jgi:DnaJ-class molecular chaperone